MWDDKGARSNIFNVWIISAEQRWSNAVGVANEGKANNKVSRWMATVDGRSDARDNKTFYLSLITCKNLAGNGLAGIITGWIKCVFCTGRLIQHKRDIKATKGASTRRLTPDTLWKCGRSLSKDNCTLSSLSIFSIFARRNEAIAVMKTVARFLWQFAVIFYPRNCPLIYKIQNH